MNRLSQLTKLINNYYVRICLVVALIIFVILAGLIFFIQVFPFEKGKFFTENNFPSRTQTKTGAPGDPVNVLIIGSKPFLIKSFKEAGWKLPDSITTKSSVKIAVDSLEKSSYPKAPVSNLYLYHRKQDLAFEKPTKNVRVREHIRLWKTTATYNHEEIWLGSATYDDGIELSGRTDLPTHRIAPSVDEERQRVMHDLSPYMQAALMAPFDEPNLFGFNGGDDWYYTDGDIAVLSAKPLSKNQFKTTHAFPLLLKQDLVKLLSGVIKLV